jgi:hypothetical protein
LFHENAVSACRLLAFELITGKISGVEVIIVGDAHHRKQRDAPGEG